MKIPAKLRRCLVPAALIAAIAGCSGGGTTPDTAPTAPPLTKESLKSSVSDVNAGAGGMPNPGVRAPVKNEVK